MSTENEAVIILMISFIFEVIITVASTHANPNTRWCCLSFASIAL